MGTDSPLRLTLVTETFPPEVNGVARTLARWVDAFTERGHRVRVLRPRQPAEPASPHVVHGVPLPFYPQVRVGVASPLRLRGVLSQDRPDLVHVATEGPLGWTALVAATTLGIPVASSFHTNFDHYLAHYGFAGFEYLLSSYLAWFHNQTAVTLAPSRATCQRLREIGIRDVELWSRGVDAELFHPRHRDPGLRSELGLTESSVLLLYVGRLAPEKNLAALLDSYACLRREVSDSVREQLRLALVGGGPLTASLQASAPPGVILAGEKHGTELSRWFASADVFAFPSRSETFGNVVLEAQASGLPVVAFNSQAINERVAPGEDGLLADTDAEFANALELLTLDPSRRAYYGTAARKKAETQGWSAIFDRLEALYYSLLSARPSQLATTRSPAGAV